MPTELRAVFFFSSPFVYLEVFFFFSFFFSSERHGALVSIT